MVGVLSETMKNYLNYRYAKCLPSFLFYNLLILKHYFFLAGLVREVARHGCHEVWHAVHTSF